MCAMAVPAFAHEERELEGVTISFGWRNEPAFAGFINGPDLYISLPEATPDQQSTLEALPVDIQVEVTFGGETMTMTLEPDFPFYEEFDGIGYVNYVSTLIPMLPGDYVFRVFGTIGDVQVDETFDSAEGGFSTIEPATDVMFPQAAAADIPALLARMAALEARIAVLEG
jgi:hypothetical protein